MVVMVDMVLVQVLVHMEVVQKVGQKVAQKAVQKGLLVKVSTLDVQVVNLLHEKVLLALCDDGNGERIFELPFYFSHSYINDEQQIEIVINQYSPEESDTDEFEWYWVPYIQEAYFGQIDYYHCTEKHRSDIGKKVHQYLTEKYGAHGADDHFTNCVIYNLETEEEHSFPDAYMN